MSLNLLTVGKVTSLTGADHIKKNLEAHPYELRVNPQNGSFELHAAEPFVMPVKVYGGHDAFGDRCLKTYKALKKGMAVLLSGPKGSGKTLTSKQLANASGMPTIVVTMGFDAAHMGSFLSDLPNACVVLLDEWEKLYPDKASRNGFLSLLDGMNNTRHLFVLTSNDPDIGEYFSNRPGRIRYHKEYGDIEQQVLLDMIADKMKKGKLRTAVEGLVKQMGVLSLDSLTCLIQECLIHNEIPKEFMSFFNLKDELGGYYDVSIRTTGLKINPKLTKEELKKNADVIKSIMNNGFEWSSMYYAKDLEKFFIKTTEIWEAIYSRPFQVEDGDEPFDLNDNFTAIVSYARNERSPNAKSFQIQHNQVKSVSRVKGVIHVDLLKGDHYEFRPAKRYKRSLD